MELIDIILGTVGGLLINLSALWVAWSLFVPEDIQTKIIYWVDDNIIGWFRRRRKKKDNPLLDIITDDLKKDE